MQKIVNGIAIASGVVSLTVVGVAGYVFIRKDAIIENIKGKVMESVLPGGLSSALGGGGFGGAVELDDFTPPKGEPRTIAPMSPDMGPVPPSSPF